MDNLKIFKDESGIFEVATKLENGEWIFDTETVAKSLGFTEVKNGKEYIRWRTVNGYLKFSQDVAKGDFIPEPAVYKLAFKASNEVAEKFQDWLAIEVLPSIRKHGMYATDELLDNPDLLIAAATKLKEERAARLEAEKQRDKLVHQNKLYTTSEIAKELGLSSATKLNNLLSDKKIQYKQNRTWLLYSKYSECGYVSIKQDVLDNGHIIYDRKWTGKGRDFILNLFKEEC
ncbi:phage antirepressor KilAC domain-containing protein [Clostridium sp. UBA7791]|uniref:phage antirepressor KilAC domain-containing protein n=1 Tax=Clostridium sp. UBA7791 TaxID=1946379 RepID=UPI0032168B33